MMFKSNRSKMNLLFQNARKARCFSTGNSYPFYKICNTYQKIEDEPGRKLKLELVQQQLSDFNHDMSMIKDFYRLSTGLVQPKFMNNQDNVYAEVENIKTNNARAQKMRAMNIADQILQASLMSFFRKEVSEYHFRELMKQIGCQAKLG